MKAGVLFYNTRESWDTFQLESGVRTWGILMLTTAGRYTLELPESGQRYTVLPNMISYIPPNTQFVRKIQEPIDFHQFHIRCEEHPVTAKLRPGILTIPKEQVAAIARSLRKNGGGSDRYAPAYCRAYPCGKLFVFYENRRFGL